MGSWPNEVKDEAVDDTTDDAVDDAEETDLVDGDGPSMACLKCLMNWNGRPQVWGRQWAHLGWQIR